MSFDPAADLQADDRRNPLTGRAWDVALCLLSNPKRAWTNATIATATGLSRGFVSRVLTGLAGEVPSMAAEWRCQACAQLLAAAANHWPRPVAYLKTVELPPVARFPIGGAYAETIAGYAGGDHANGYITNRKQAYEVVALMTGGFVEQHSVDGQQGDLREVIRNDKRMSSAVQGARRRASRVLAVGEPGRC